MLRWANEDDYYKAKPVKFPILSQLISRLEVHLLLWRANYEIWIPDNIKHNERHCLVFLADEAEHGVGFPHGIEEVVRKQLRFPQPAKETRDEVSGGHPAETPESRRERV